MADLPSPSAAADSVAALQTRVAALEAENRALREPAREQRKARRSPGRATLSAVLIVVGLLAGTAGLVSAYAKQQLLDTSNFIASFAPLAEDDAVQSVATDAVVTAINDAIDIPGLTADVIGGIRELDLPPRADAALGLLEAPAAQGLQGLVESSVAAIVASEAFSGTWEEALRVSHTQTMAALRGEDDAALAISDGALHLQIGPLVAEAKQRLLDKGITLADAVPAVDRSVVLIEDAAIEHVRTVVTVVDAAGAWLPWASLLLLIAGVSVARRRQRAVIVAAVSTAILMGVVTVGIASAGRVLVRAADRGAGVMTGAAMQSVFGAATGMITQMAVALGTLAVAVAVIAWAAGPSRFAVALRSATTTAAHSVRSRAEQRGLTTGRAGEWLDGNHRLVLAAIGVGGAAVVLLARPLSPSVIVWTAVVSVVAVLVIQVLRRPALSSPDSLAPASPEGTHNA